MNSSCGNDSKCAACGKGGGGLKRCNACKQVKYCDSICQRAHRPEHKTECKRRAAELFDEALFAQPPPPEDCPICCLPLPIPTDLEQDDQTLYQECCGVIICLGCVHAVYKSGRGVCPFCRAPVADCDEELKRVKNLAEKNDAKAIKLLASFYDVASIGLPQNTEKAIELWLRAGKLGCARSYYNIATCYKNGHGVKLNMTKCKYFYQLSAMGGVREITSLPWCYGGYARQF